MTISFIAPGPLVIVHDFNIPRIVIDPPKADAPLVIYPNAHLRLLDDGLSVSWKLHQDKVNKAQALVYEAKRNLVPQRIDASSK